MMAATFAAPRVLPIVREGDGRPSEVVVVVPEVRSEPTLPDSVCQRSLRFRRPKRRNGGEQRFGARAWRVAHFLAEDVLAFSQLRLDDGCAWGGGVSKTAASKGVA